MLHSFQALAKPTTSRELARASLAPLPARTPPKQVLSEHARPFLAKPLTPAGFYPGFKHVDLASRSQRTWSLWYDHLEEITGFSQLLFLISGLHSSQEVCTECPLCARPYVELCEGKEKSDTPQEGRQKGS